MRKETKRICQAFIEGRSAKAARTYTDGLSLYLHGHCIASWDVEWSDDHEPISVNRRILHLCCCGYGTPTTKERLNGLLYLLGFGRPYFTSNYQLFFGSKLRPVDPYETITIDVDLMRELTNDNTITPKQIAA